MFGQATDLRADELLGPELGLCSLVPVDQRDDEAPPCEVDGRQTAGEPGTDDGDVDRRG